MSTTHNQKIGGSPRRLVEAVRCVVGRRARRVVAIVGTATLVWLPTSPSHAQVSVAPSWCNTNGGNERPWVTFLGRRPQSYVLQLSGNPGLLPNGQVALLGYFASPTGGAVYFVPNTGAANPPKIRLGLVTNISAPPNDPLNYQGTISLPVHVLPWAPDSQSVIGNLVFEISGKVLPPVPLYWPTTDVKVKAITPLPEWDPLQPTRAASVIAGTAPQPVEFEFEVEFRGCPPLHLQVGTIWDNASQMAIVSPLARFDRMDSGPYALPGKATIWIKEADLYHPPLRSPTDGILFSLMATDHSGGPYIPVRKPFTITQPPGSIDLASRQCSYQVDVGHTGGYKISYVMAWEQKRFTGLYGIPARPQWTVHRQALLGGAVLQMIVPYDVLVRAATHSSSQVWVVITQEVPSPFGGELTIQIDVINAPNPPSAYVPSGPCP